MTYSFRKMFLASQNLKDVCITYFLLELLIFFCLTVVDIYCLKFVSHYIKEILYVNTGPIETNHEKKNIFSCFWYWCWKILFFVNVKLDIFMHNFYFFSVSWTQFLSFRCSRSQMFLKLGASKNFCNIPN